MSAAQPEPSDGPTSMFRRCAACDASAGLYLPPWARTADLAWDTHLVDEHSPWVGTTYCTFCKTPASYALPTRPGPPGPGLSP
ncbi:MAG: hypothetical protein ACLPVY_13785 [Acidimicrobiia bacterium]